MLGVVERILPPARSVGGVTDQAPGDRRWAFLLAVGVSDVGTGLYLPVAVPYLVDRSLGQALIGSIWPPRRW